MHVTKRRLNVTSSAEENNVLQSLIIGEIEVKTTVSYQLNPGRRAIIKDITCTNNGKRGKPLHNVGAQLLWKVTWTLLEILKIDGPCDSAIKYISLGKKICAWKRYLHSFAHWSPVHNTTQPYCLLSWWIELWQIWSHLTHRWMRGKNWGRLIKSVKLKVDRSKKLCFSYYRMTVGQLLENLLDKGIFNNSLAYYWDCQIFRFC